MKRGLGKIAAINNWFEPSVDLRPNIYSRTPLPLAPHPYTHTRTLARTRTRTQHCYIVFFTEFPFFNLSFLCTHIVPFLIKREITSNFLTRILYLRLSHRLLLIAMMRCCLSIWKACNGEHVDLSHPCLFEGNKSFPLPMKMLPFLHFYSTFKTLFIGW